MWYLTLVDLDVKPHSVHCHLPLPRLTIIEFNKAAHVRYLAWVVLMESVNVCYQRVPRLAKLLAVLAVVTGVVEVLTLDMVVQV